MHESVIAFQAANRGKALRMLLAAAVLWSSSGLLIKLIDWHPMAVASGRSAIAILTILLITKKLPIFTFSSNQLIGATAYAITVTTFVVATTLTTAANAIMLQYTAPIHVALLSGWLLKEKITRKDWAIITITLAGMVLFFLDDLSVGNLWGNFIAILSGLAFGFLIVFLRKQKDSSTIDTVILGNILAFLLGIPFVLGSATPDLSSSLGVVFLGIFQLGLPYFLYSVAIKHVTAMTASITTLIEPLFNPIWVFLFLGEAPGPWSLLGGALVLTSITAHSFIATRFHKPL
ncbi:MAG TPA: DMT family transporter [Candidatus Limnocylindrales bacterium]|nr:DMT family transporter [Candidatus Limnocylindrales bacterium]